MERKPPQLHYGKTPRRVLPSIAASRRPTQGIMPGSSGTPQNAQNREGDWNSFDELYLAFIWSKKHQDDGTAMRHAYSDIQKDTGALFEDADDEKIVKVDVTDVIKEIVLQHFIDSTDGQDSLLILDFINAAHIKCKLLQSNKLIGFTTEKFISYLNDAMLLSSMWIPFISTHVLTWTTWTSPTFRSGAQ